MMKDLVMLLNLISTSGKKLKEKMLAIYSAI